MESENIKNLIQNVFKLSYFSYAILTQNLFFFNKSMFIVTETVILIIGRLWILKPLCFMLNIQKDVSLWAWWIEQMLYFYVQWQLAF